MTRFFKAATSSTEISWTIIPVHGMSVDIQCSNTQELAAWIQCLLCATAINQNIVDAVTPFVLPAEQKRLIDLVDEDVESNFKIGTLLFSSKVKTYELWRLGNTIQYISLTRKIAEETVWKHIIDCIRDGYDYSFSTLPISAVDKVTVVSFALLFCQNNNVEFKLDNLLIKDITNAFVAKSDFRNIPAVKINCIFAHLLRTQLLMKHSIDLLSQIPITQQSSIMRHSQIPTQHLEVSNVIENNCQHYQFLDAEYDSKQPIFSEVRFKLKRIINLKVM